MVVGEGVTSEGGSRGVPVLGKMRGLERFLRPEIGPWGSRERGPGGLGESSEVRAGARGEGVGKGWTKGSLCPA